MRSAGKILKRYYKPWVINKLLVTHINNQFNLVGPVDSVAGHIFSGYHRKVSSSPYTFSITISRKSHVCHARTRI